jgi:hypothetical protein
MEQIRRLEEEIAQREEDADARRMAHAVWTYFAALMAEGFAPADALEITLSWQMVVTGALWAGRGEG